MFKDWTYYKSVVGYNGSLFEGWQSQNHKNTIQDIIEKVLYKTFNVFQRILGASRTDSGVHARGQVFTFYAPKDIPVDKLLLILNKKLPVSIVIFFIEPVPLTFHPRYNAKKKVYEYRFSNHKMCSLMFQNVFNLGFSINKIDLLKNLKIFEGTHDFFLFSSTEGGKNSIRTIYNISFGEESDGEIICIKIEGDGFLRYMIRNIVGTAIFFTQNNFNNNILINFLKKNNSNEKKNKEVNYFIKKIMPIGLTLAKIYY